MKRDHSSDLYCMNRLSKPVVASDIIEVEVTGKKTPVLSVLVP